MSLLWSATAILELRAQALRLLQRDVRAAASLKVARAAAWTGGATRGFTG
jgi:hypothetical protein